jgi:hypothetical protein
MRMTRIPNSMNYLFIVYPDGHGSVELTDGNFNVLGLAGLFKDVEGMEQILRVLRKSYPLVEIRFENRQ